MNVTHRARKNIERNSFSAVFEFSWESVAARLLGALVFALFCVLLVFLAVSNFIVGGLIDDRISADRAALTSAVSYFPDSARLHFRLAAAMEDEGELSGAEFHAQQAIKASPFNYNYYLLLAQIEESDNEPAAAEQSLRTAVRLAPQRTQVRWRLANLLLRRGDSNQAFEEFSHACSLDQRLLPVTLNLVWRASGGSLEALNAVTSPKPGDRLALAQFLLKQSLVSEAASVFDSLDKSTGIDSPEGTEFLKSLVSAGHLKLARGLWTHSMGADASSPPLIWNGSFESDIAKSFSQFDWAIRGSEYAKVRISTDLRRSGARSVRIDFTGRDTTRLNEEIRQLIVVRPGARYRMECYARAEGLVTSEGPRLAVTSAVSSLPIAESEPVQANQSGWQHLAVAFVAPESTADDLALFVAISRKPKFSFDEPMRGRIWFDDFTLVETGK